MFFKTSTIAAVAALLGAGVAMPSAPFSSQNVTAAIGKRGLDCQHPVHGLSHEDCQHMHNIGFGSMGKNSGHHNGAIWVGHDGPTTFTFTNRAEEGAGGPAALVVVVWLQTDHQSSFVNVRQPYVTWSLPHLGDSVTVSMANGISGAFAALHGRVTTLKDGHIFNTWGEWSTGPWATVDVSRLPNMRGNRMEIHTPGGCHANMDRCVYKCKNADRCGASGEYYLQDCEPNSQKGGPHIHIDEQGNPNGGCGGYSDRGHVQVDFHH